MARVAPVIAEIAMRFAENTVFTRFLTAHTPEAAEGMWRRYYRRWHSVTRAEIDTELLDLIPLLKRFVPPATIINKVHYSPFTEPILLQHLRQREADTVVVTGAETDVCVLATVLGAMDHGFRTIVVTDAICSSADEHHDALMKLYHQRFGEQVETADAQMVLSQWERP